jgi:hypothetical protein
MGFDHSEVAKLIGEESGPIPAPDEVSKSDIRHWCEFIGDPDPAYVQKIKQGEKAAPATMLMAWAMDPLWPPKEEAREPHEKVLKRLADAGYSVTVGLELDQEFHRAVPPGDRLSFQVKVIDVSKTEEETKLGKGYRLELLYTFLNRDGELVSTQNYKLVALQRMSPAS